MELKEIAELMYDTATRLNHRERMLTVERQEAATKINILHAVVSIMACQTGTLATMAEAVLEAVGLDPMHDVEMVLAGIAPIPTKFTPQPLDRLGRADEQMMIVPLRKLIDTIIMVQACSDMLCKLPKLKRREVVDKLDMTIETLYDSYGLSREEVLAALRPNDSKFDVGGEMVA